MISRCPWVLGPVVAVSFFTFHARAEPHLSARTGLRCGRCHTNPTGGGKRSLYGALYAQTTLTMQRARPITSPPTDRGAPGSWETTGVSVGEVTSWLGIGADLRIANITTFTEDRQSSFEATRGSLYLELRPWPDRITLYLDEEVAAGGALSREAWALVRGPFATYLKAGWLLPPFGLRVLDDDAYTRRVTGANFANSDLGFELGWETGPLFAAIALTNGNFSGGDSDTLKALYGLLELNLSQGRIGLSGAYNPSEDGCRSMTGLFGGLRLGRLVLEGELDLIAVRPAEKNRHGYQLAGLAAADLLLTKGLGLRVAYDYTDGDLELGQDRRQRLAVGIDLFLLRMLEVKLYYLLKQSETRQPLDAADRLEVTLHVYL